MYGTGIKKAALGIGCALLGTALFSSSASATVDVTSTTDNGSGCTLREAVSSANQNMSIGGCADPTAVWSEIELDAGTYTLAGQVGENSNAGGDLDVADASLRIVGQGLEQTTINGDDKDRVVDVVGVNTNLILDDLRILDGNATTVGGGAVQSLDGSLNISGVRFESNRTAGHGGALRSNGPVAIESSTFTGNSSGGDGGALALTGNNVSTLTRSSLEGNSAPAAGSDGGGITLSSSSAIEIRNSTLSGNSTAGTGGAIRVASDAGSGSNLQFVTIASNSASGGGGGVYVNAGRAVAVKTSILAGNTGAAGASNCGGAGSVVPEPLEGYMIESADTCDFSTAASEHNQINTDPQLAPLASNGGPTQTHALYAGSPAIDAVPFSSCTLVDQRDSGRPVNGFCDIGAFEGSIPKPATTGPVDTGPKATPAKKCPKGRKLVKKKGKRKCVKRKKRK
jgi:predicted outer membrane repeat protein